MSPKVSASSRPYTRGVSPFFLIGLRWRKIGRDLLSSPLRTLLVILSIAVGVFAFGTIMGARNIITRELDANFQGIRPASAILHTSLFDAAFVDSVRRMAGVGAAEGRRTIPVRVRVGSDEWKNLRLIVVDDYENIEVNIIRPFSGAWPPPDRTLLVERNSLFMTAAGVGDTITVELADGKIRRLPISGLAHDVNQLPAQVFNIGYAYITADTVAWLGLPPGFDELQIVVAEQPLDKKHIAEVAQAVQEKVERSGRVVRLTDVPEPGQHPAQELIPTIILILGAVGLLALILSGFLIINTIASIMTQHVRQIGVMKAIGATSTTVLTLYLRMILVFGVLALSLAIPLGAFAARQLAAFVGNQLNIDIVRSQLDPSVLVVEVAAGLLVPIIASFYPLSSAARITVRDAISDTGISESSSSATVVDWLLQRAQVARPLRLSLRNTFRRKTRLALTLITLVFGGAVFISVLTVRASLFATLEDTVRNLGYDVQVELARPYRRETAEQVVAAVPGVTAVESWRIAQSAPVHPDGTEGETVFLNATPPDTQIYQASLTAGRWFNAADTNAIVVHANLMAKEPTLKLGGEILLHIAGSDYPFRIIGVTSDFQPPVGPTIAYVNYNYLSRLLGGANHTNLLQIVTSQHDEPFHKQIAAEVEKALAAAEYKVTSTKSTSDTRNTLTERFNILTSVLLIMSSLVAIVGALGLMGTMSINVLERRREIGVMRAIGAADRAVILIFVTEGMVIGLISWLGAMILSQPMSRLMSNRIGLQLLNLPLDYTFSWQGALIWLVVVSCLSIVASQLPARSAANLKVRDTLAYE